jgi:cytidylate kinase
VPVITVSRQFGAGGAAVGRLLARRFDAEYLDRDVVFEAARRAGLPEAIAHEMDERTPGWITRLGMAFAGAYPEIITPDTAGDAPVPGDEDRVARFARDVIVEAADRGNAVVVGRGGAFVLRDRPTVLHVQLIASLEARVRYCRMRVEELDVPEPPDDASLARLCQRVDAARGDYLRRHFGVDWRDPSHYHLVLDTGRLGLETTAGLIATAAERLDSQA